MKTDFLSGIKEKPAGIDDMQDRAYEVLDRFSMRRVPRGGVKIVKILNGFGIKTYLDDIKPGSLYAYIVVAPALWEKFGTDRIACVNTALSDGDKRFALANELAHFLFDHDGSPAYMDAYVADMTVKELRADRFAACILMPEDVFREKYDEISQSQLNPDTAGWLARYFRVSRDAVIKRLSGLRECDQGKLGIPTERMRDYRDDRGFHMPCKVHER